VRVLLTGANGFVGSHTLDALVEAGHEVAVMLRTTSDTRFIERHLPGLDVRYGTLDDERSLREAVRGASAVVHCAGKTKAVRRKDYYAVNADGARRMAEACNARAATVEHLVLISSLAVSGPGTRQRPALEEAPPRPVSTYGKSKALGEQWAREVSRVPLTVLRPAAVYGPRDVDFCPAFRAVSRGWKPLLGGGRAGLSLVFARDLARAVLACLDPGQARGGTYHVAHPVAWTQRAFLARIAEALGVRARRLRLPRVALYPVCLAGEVRARLTGSATMLNLQKIPELSAPGWVCSTRKARRELGFVAETELDDGIRATLDWYRRQGWL
jgi:nucleoside-diphosphate-sugar epimerase